MAPLTTLSAVLFSVSIIFTYLWVRLNWVSIPSALVLGFTFNALFFSVFAFTRGSGSVDALSIGVMQSLIFTVAAVSMGAFFRPMPDDELAQERYELDSFLEHMPIDLKA